MLSEFQVSPVSRKRLWAGRVVSALVILFLLFDASIKILKLPPAVEGTVQLGYPANTVFPIGLVLLLSTILYAIPRTSVFGAILLTAYLGGATATMVRVGAVLFLFPVIFGVLVWAGLVLRDAQLTAAIFLRR
ncbi:MAG TPA: DoxX family protein [Terriglobales bacterium]|nr:DoxX family protein [Terriglobales bacterium]